MCHLWRLLKYLNYKDQKTKQNTHTKTTTQQQQQNNNNKTYRIFKKSILKLREGFYQGANLFLYTTQLPVLFE